MGKLTGDRFGAEDGRKVVADERGEARGGASMVDGGLVRDFGRVGARPRSWVVGVGGRRGCALGVRRIDAGRRAVAGATNGGDSARLRSHELDLAPRKEKGWKGGEGSRARERIRAVPRRRGTPG